MPTPDAKATAVIERMRARGFLPKNKNAPTVAVSMASGDNKDEHHEVSNDTQPSSYPTATADVKYQVRTASVGIYNPFNPAKPRPLSAAETAAVNPRFQQASPEIATLNRPQAFPEQQTMAYYAGRMLSSDVARGFGGMLTNHGAVPSALATGALGYGGGKLIDWIMSRLGRDTNTAQYLGGLGAVLGGGIGYARSHVKEAATIQYGRDYGDKEATVEQIMDRVDRSMGIMSMDRASIMAELNGMSSSELARIWQQVRSVAPFAVGALLTRLLFGTGVIGSAVGGMLTQTVANSFSNNNTAGVWNTPFQF